MTIWKHCLSVITVNPSILANITIIAGGNPSSFAAIRIYMVHRVLHFLPSHISARRLEEMTLTSPTVHASITDLFVPGERLLAGSNTSHDRLVIGVAVFHPSLADPAILIVQRAAHEEFLPNVWELPGGHVEATDATIIDAVVRETFEETGLRVSHVLGRFEDFVYSVQKADSTGAVVAKSTLQVNLAVKVEVHELGQELAVTLSPDEHQKYAWVTETALEGYGMTEGMSKVVTDALRWRKSHAQDLGAPATVS